MIHWHKLVVVCLPLPFAWSATLGHHATGPSFDRSQIIEAEGTITGVFWRNPHVRFTMAELGPDGRERSWEIETNSVSIVSRLGLTPELVQPGATVRIAGNPNRLSDTSMWLTNMLLPNDQEILFGARNQPRWSDDTIGAPVRGDITGDPTGELGIFRVWTSGGGGGALWNSSYPLTEAARAVQAQYDPLTDDPTANCAPKGMPYIMEQPYPMQIVDSGDQIVLQLEEYDTMRTIALNPDAAFLAQPASRLGRSIGRWDGEDLVVSTTGIDYPFFNNRGIRQSDAVVIEERFSLNEDGSELLYEMIVTDPATFTEPVLLDKSWVWRPGEEIRPYDCTLTD